MKVRVLFAGFVLGLAALAASAKMPNHVVTVGPPALCPPEMPDCPLNN